MSTLFSAYAEILEVIFINPFVENVTEILKDSKISKNKMLSDLNLSKNSFVDWNKRGTIPSAKVVSAIAEYLGTTVGTLMGYEENEEVFQNFSQKIAYQLAVNCKTISELANYLGVPDDLIMDWIKGSDGSYVNYYEELSTFFEVMIRYWTSPGMISPGIEPNTDEYNLILLYRAYNQTGKFNEYYGRLEKYFPGIQVVATEGANYNLDSEILSLLHKLPPENKLEFKGEIKGYIRRMEEETVAAESSSDNATKKSLA